MGAEFIQEIALTPNPQELEDYIFLHPADIDELSVFVRYELSGDIPEGLDIDENGTISGVIEHFGNQPLLADDIIPGEKPLIDGSNWMRAGGRYSENSYEFNFTISVIFKEDELTEEESVVSKRCTLTLEKDNDIDTYIFLNEYQKHYEMGDNFDINRFKK